MTIRRQIELYNLFNSLSNGVTQLIEGKPTTIQFKFSAKARLTIARNMHKLKANIGCFEAARDALREQYNWPFSTITDKGAKEYLAAEEALLSEECVIKELDPISESEFLDNDNPVPPSIIAGLLDYIV